MKKLIILLLLMLSYSISAQTTFTFSSKEFMDWNENTQRFDNSSGVYSDNSAMIFNDNQDVIVHKTTTITSTYYVTGTDHEEDFLQFFVTSDVGNDYLFMVDIQKNLFKIISMTKGNSYLIIFEIKAVF